MSDLPGPSLFAHKASGLIWYEKTALQDPRLDRPSNWRNSSSLGPRDPRYEVKVLRETPESQILEVFDRSRGQVAALVPGQALDGGIGPYTPIDDEQSITYLSAKNVPRWSKLAEWLDKNEHRNPRYQFTLSHRRKTLALIIHRTGSLMTSPGVRSQSLSLIYQETHRQS